eukprot:CAMPEP_0113302202 /NCGR_PEP_ID=MMETSP0010_2-20120614/3113_1 /TAXON_ID=216773 ORGANISM="Corethron hystrix, Strain 308" /NCGR_SAMPLE_ID=MMETSP0010_2 /ASSEMBLY_ACC=CAM_ASM_000155 /LENGTH=172 /DNA_ID=CAMNT_0000155953 /DNA_START=128 /DNA_END=643 /DNA_ORIENTATION=+ /assembly_acc=CAM_ASM_000155
MVVSSLSASVATPVARSTTLRTMLTSTAMKWAVGPFTLFIAENFILSENRTAIIQFLDKDANDRTEGTDGVLHREGTKRSELSASPTVGDDRYHVLYGACSTAACASILYGYRYKVRNAAPHFPPGSLIGGPRGIALSFLLQTSGLILLSQTLPKLQIPVVFRSGEEPVAGP